jgi:hypothetical protein
VCGAALDRTLKPGRDGVPSRSSVGLLLPESRLDLPIVRDG